MVSEGRSELGIFHAWRIFCTVKKGENIMLRILTEQYMLRGLMEGYTAAAAEPASVQLEGFVDEDDRNGEVENEFPVVPVEGGDGEDRRDEGRVEDHKMD